MQVYAIHEGTRSRMPQVDCRHCPVTAAVFLAVALTLAAPAGAIIIDSIDGSANTSAPSGGDPDPGWAHVGKRSDLCAVYLRNGWVLTANHVPLGDVLLDGVLYTAVPGTETRLDDGFGALADLKVFGITPEPPLPDLAIRSSSSLPSGKVIMIGQGYNRGAETDSDDPLVWAGPEANPDPAVGGYLWGAGKTMRWGENTVTAAWPDDPLNTVTFYTTFDVSDQTHEAQATVGDSGGALFAKHQGS